MDSLSEGMARVPANAVHGWHKTGGGGDCGGMRTANQTPRRSDVDDITALVRNIMGPVMDGGLIICNQKFPATADQVLRMRRVLRQALAGHPEFATIELLASELAANSVRHSGSRFFVLYVVPIQRDGVRVAIIDEARKGFPRLENQPVGAERGRGLRIVNAMAQRWGIARNPTGGGAVWFEYSP